MTRPWFPCRLNFTGMVAPALNLFRAGGLATGEKNPLNRYGTTPKSQWLADDVSPGWVPVLAVPPVPGSAVPEAVAGGGLSAWGVTRPEGAEGALVSTALVAVTVKV